MSIRRACGNLLLDTSTFHYRSRRPDQAALKERIKDICETRVRYGYRRVHVMLRREGWFVNQKKVRRIYNEMGLQLRNKHPKRKVRAKLIRDRKEAVSPLEVWAMDFVHDQLATGRKFRILTVVDTWSRYVPAVTVRPTRPTRGDAPVLRSVSLSVRPGHEVFKAGDLGVGDVGEDICEPGLRIDTVELGGLDEGIGDRRGLAAAG